MAAYVIFEGDVHDADVFERYKPLAAASVEQAGGRYLVRGGRTDVLDGEGVTSRTVVVEFPDRQAALDWYEGAYRDARQLRLAATTGRMFVVEGV